MSIFKKNIIGVDIFNESLTICGYEFDEKKYKKIEQKFSDIEGINVFNFESRKKELKQFFKCIVISMGYSLREPYLIMPYPNEYRPLLEDIYPIANDSGFDQIQFCDELLVAAVGCNLPLGETNDDGLYEKFIFISCKKITTTFCIICAGGVYEINTVNSKLSDMSRVSFEDSINKLKNKKIDLPAEFNNKIYTDEIRNQMRSSLSSEIHDIYIMNTENDSVDFNLDGLDIQYFNECKYLELGLNKILGVTTQSEQIVLTK